MRLNLQCIIVPSWGEIRQYLFLTESINRGENDDCPLQSIEFRKSVFNSPIEQKRKATLRAINLRNLIYITRLNLLTLRTPSLRERENITTFVCGYGMTNR